MNVLDAFTNTVHSAIGGAEALAVRMGMSATILRNKANPNNTHNKPLLEDADRIISLTGDASILHALAANHGYVALKVDAGEGACDINVAECVVKVMASGGNFAQAILDAWADERITEQELEAIEKAMYAMFKAAKEAHVKTRGQAGTTHHHP